MSVPQRITSPQLPNSGIQLDCFVQFIDFNVVIRLSFCKIMLDTLENFYAYPQLTPQCIQAWNVCWLASFIIEIIQKMIKSSFAWADEKRSVGKTRLHWSTSLSVGLFSTRRDYVTRGGICTATSDRLCKMMYHSAQ